MATYKVIQDIEAEDKLLGPLTLRQFIYGAVAALCLYFCFLSLSKHVPFLLFIFLPIAGASGFFAFPWSLNQPTEVWALAKIRFFLKPRKRIWDQSGVRELVTITAPKTVQTHYSNGLSETEVKSRLRALADTIDSRGWAIKNVNVNMSALPANLAINSDRLVDLATLPQDVPNIDVQAADDILDERNNPTAQHFDQMISASDKTHRQLIMDKLRQAAGKLQPSSSTAAQPNDYWFLNQPKGAPVGSAVFDSAVVNPGPTQATTNPQPDDSQLSQVLKSQKAMPQVAYSHMHTLNPTQPGTPDAAQTTPVTPKPTPAILDLANNNDLNVATLARQAQRKANGTDTNEVVISLR